jgi:hypothetical protein
MRSAMTISSLATILACSLFAACSDDEGSGIDEDGDGGGANSSGTGATGGTDGGTAGGAAGAGTGGTTAPACEELVGIDTEQCGVSTASAEFKTPNILLVVDRSASMEDQPSGFTINKWEALKTALSEALATVQGQVSFGLELFPPVDCTEGCCPFPAGDAAVNVPVGPGITTVPQILSTLETAGYAGGTPTADALQRALEYFTTGSGKDLVGEKFVLLATDGGPNCNQNLTCATPATCTANIDEQGSCTKTGPNCCAGAASISCLDNVRTEQQIQALAASGIPTFVVGIPGTEDYATYLNSFAVAGGKPAAGGGYYAVTAEGGVQGLTDVFTTITTQLIRACEIQLQSDPPNLQEVNVALDCAVVPQTTGDGSGWELDTATTPDTVRLLGTFCEYVQVNGVERVDVIFGCPTVR